MSPTAATHSLVTWQQNPSWGCSGHPWVARHPQQPPRCSGSPGLGSSLKSGDLPLVTCPMGLSGFNFQPCPCPQVL